MASGVDFPLHESVFNGDVENVSRLVKTCDVSQKDKHGNTALHLAVMLGHKRCVELLLEHGATTVIENSEGWSPFDESLSYGSREIIRLLLLQTKQQGKDIFNERRPILVKAAKDLQDFDLEAKCEVRSWVPLVSKMLPPDIFARVRKKGSRIRLDINVFPNTSLIFHGDTDTEGTPNLYVTVLNNKDKVFETISLYKPDAEDTAEYTEEEKKEHLEEEIDLWMSSDIATTDMSNRSIEFTRCKTGWLFRRAKTETIGRYTADIYSVNLTHAVHTRQEHLSAEDKQINDAKIEDMFKQGAENKDGITTERTAQYLKDSQKRGEIFGLERRDSLVPPDKCNISWSQYISATQGNPPCIGRTKVFKDKSQSWKATVAMSTDFPMKIDDFDDIIRTISNDYKFQKYKDLRARKLPPGFPVRLEIPVFPTVTATLTMNSFDLTPNQTDAMFCAPDDYSDVGVGEEPKEPEGPSTPKQTAKTAGKQVITAMSKPPRKASGNNHTASPESSGKNKKMFRIRCCSCCCRRKKS